MKSENRPLVVGLCGLAGSGKSTVAEMLRRELHESYRLGVEIIPFAKPLKDGLAAMGIVKGLNPDLYRDAAQRLGTDIVRRRHPNWWCDEFNKAVQSSTADVVIADDVRFKNERDTIFYRGGMIFYIDAARRLRVQRRSRWRRDAWKFVRFGPYRHESESFAIRCAKEVLKYGDIVGGDGVIYAGKPVDSNCVLDGNVKATAMQIALKLGVKIEADF